MKVVTGTQMTDIDQKAINDLQIDGMILMENAGREVFEHIVELVEDWHDEHAGCFKNAVVIAGKGNNGGDGFVIARHLIQNGVPTQVFAIAERQDYSGDALKNYLALENFGDINLIADDTIEDLRDAILEASVVVDALLGTGIKGNVEGISASVIEVINESEGIIVAVDIPSGVDADTGNVGTVAVEADYTVTFAAPKLGLLLYPGADYSGNILVADIGIPDFLFDNNGSKVYITDEDYVFNLLPIRPPNTNKGTYGKVLTIGGSKTMTGAGLLTAYSVLKVGAGLSTLAAPESLIPYYIGSYPEITYLPLRENADCTISAGAFEDIKDKLKDYETVIIGPGLSVTEDTITFTKNIIQHCTENNIPLVVDADGLNCMSKLVDIKLSSNAIITPHPMELSRLLQADMDDILDDKLKYLEEVKSKYNCTVVFKGSNSLIAFLDYIFINTTGNSGLSSGGTGDVLTGIIGGFMGQGLSSFEAGIAGVYLHGLAADIAVEDVTEYSLTATDVIDYIPDALMSIDII